MDNFEDIAALALGSSLPVSIADSAEAYEKEGVERLPKH
jgi:hypothetical protein